MGRLELAAFVLFLMLGGGLLAQLDARRRDPGQCLVWGGLALISGSSLLTIGVVLEIPWLLLLGAAVAGSATHGWLYVGGLRRTVNASQGDAHATSAYLLAAYVGFGGAPLLVGLALDQLGTSLGYALSALLVALAASVLMVTEQRRAQLSK